MLEARTIFQSFRKIGVPIEYAVDLHILAQFVALAIAIGLIGCEL